MRRLVAYELLSLEGVAESPDEFITVFDDMMRANLQRVIETQDTVLLGRRTYDEWANFWPSSDIEPFSTFINRVSKYVVTSTPPDVPWDNSHVVEGALADFVSELKSRAGGDIGLHGSIQLTQTLLGLGLVDDLRLVVAPVLHARGRRLFDHGGAAPLALTGHAVSPTGHLLVDYHVTR